MPPQSWDWHETAWGWDLEKFLSVCDEAVDADFLFKSGLPDKGVRHLHSLHDKGHSIHIITSRSFGKRSPHNTADWLHEHCIPYDSLIMTHKKSMVRPDIMIDDYEKNFVQMSKVGVDTWLLDQPWNQHVQTDKRVFSLEEFEYVVDRKAALDD